MDIADCINFQLGNAQNAVSNYFKMVLSPYDVTPIQYALLSCLWSEDMQPPSQLAQTLQSDASTISGLLDRMEKKDLIERVYNTQDRRGIYVRLKPAGKVLQAPIEEVIFKANQEITGEIEPEVLDTFVQQLKYIENRAKLVRVGSR